MSILPTQTQGSTSSSSSQPSSSNPNSDHGLLLHSSSFSGGSLSFGSLGISDSPSPGAVSGADSGAVAPTTEDSGRSFKRVIDIETTKDKRILPHQNTYTHSQCHSGGQVGFANRRGKMSGKTVSSQSHQTTGLSSSPGSNMHSAGKRVQMINGNHLLNFQYDPISRLQSRALPPPPRRQQRRKPYNKDLFIQANYKFVVLDSGNYSPESMDPDKNLQWEDIICVRYATPFPVQCPICLEYPLCPQITSCGHVFCFPCILQYLLMGEEDHKGDCWKRCPLCFVMISPKDLYTVDIENVNQYHVSDTIDFMLLTRQKDSFTLFQKNNRETGNVGCSNDEIYDTFSKFTLTSDVDLSVRKAIADLDSWLVRADSGLVDDLEKLPYVCAAMEQLEQRRKCWNEHQATDSNRSSKCDRELGSHVCPSTANATNIVDNEVHDFGHGTLSTDVSKSSEGPNTVLSSNDESKGLCGHSNGSRDMKDNDSYNFYQAVDGQHLILHPLNMKCMLHHYGSYDMLPHRIRGKILQFESVTQSEAIRRRYRYLSHFSLTTTFQLCEIDLSEILPPESLSPFMDEIKKREKQRKQLAKKERKDKLKAEAAGTDYVPTLSSFGQSSYLDPPSMDDFEALGTPIMMSSSPPTIGERKLFSSVAKLGFAAGHDSPALKIEESSSLHDNFLRTDSSGVTALRNANTQSFATITSRAKSVENLDAPKMNESGKKGKKPSRVLLSTAGARRY